MTAFAASANAGNTERGNADIDNAETDNTDAARAETAVRVERVLAWAMTFFRLGGICQASIVLVLAPDHFPKQGAAGALMGVVAVESGALIVACLRAGRIRTRLISADLLFCCAALAANAGVTTAVDGQTWANFMYPLTIIASIGLGLGYRSLTSVMCATAILMVSYGASAVLIHHDALWNTVPNSISYLPNITVAWGAARYLRKVARASDASRVRAVARADELARERERLRHARMLHDRVLQTMETLAHGQWVPDRELRAHIAAEAEWLRALVEGNALGDGQGDLLSALQAVVLRKSRLGLRVELNTVGLRDGAAPGADLEPEAVEAVADAVHEALTNVAKHAGVDAAVVRAYVTADRFVVSVLDQGRGFDSATAAGGLGLQTSIRARIAAIGGQTRIDSRPWAGTFVELSVPVRRTLDGSRVDGSAVIQPPEQAAIPGE